MTDECNEPLMAAFDRAKRQDKAVMHRIEQELEAKGIPSEFERADDLVDSQDEVYEQFQIKEGPNMPIVVTAQESVGAQLPDGVYQGVITHLEERNVTFADGKTGVYIDFHIETSGQKIKWGCSNKLTPKSKLAQTLSNFQQWKVGDKIDLESVFAGKKISFMTIKKGEWCNVVDGSIKPAIA